MNRFSYMRASTVDEAVREAAADPAARFIAGGTNLVDLMKYNVERPKRLIDITHLPLNQIEETDAGGLRIGALATNDEAAYDPRIQDRYPLLASAILAGASPQLRNSATTGGNLLQRTRCYYFRDTAYACNKRAPGSGCSALDGYNRIHAVLGTSEKCIATHPGDMPVAMVALDATVRTRRPNGAERTIPLTDFHVPYGEDPAKESVLEHGELITAVDLPAVPWFARSHYLKVRDRASYEFALASAAVALDLEGGRHGTIRAARVALGGVGTKPWRSPEAEQALTGKKADEATFRAAAEKALQNARPQKDNAFKIELAKRTLTRALATVAEMRA